VWLKLPDVTPIGNPTDGKSIATPTEVVKVAQQWMCALLVGVVSPENVKSTANVLASES
jgi:hypothetical protein